MPRVTGEKAKSRAVKESCKDKEGPLGLDAGVTGRVARMAFNPSAAAGRWWGGDRAAKAPTSQPANEEEK